MKKKIFGFVLLFSWLGLSSQPPQINTNLPSYVPPAPTVANLMKFEEIPVNKYTGVPDVSIPLFTCKARGNVLDVNLALSYHPASIAVDEVASDVGLGWNFSAGGTISRVVRGLPDELNVEGGIHTGNGKFGVYQTTAAYNGLNYGYYDALDHVVNANSTNDEKNAFDDFMWETTFKSKFDTEHDLWQFNFMGYTGRFYIKREADSLVVFPLDKYNLKIVNHYSAPQEINSYTPLGFTVYDAKGYKYIFNQVDISVSSVHTKNWYTYFAYFNDVIGSPTSYRSAFHLTKIFDPNNNLIFQVDYAYSTECARSEATIRAEYNQIAPSNTLMIGVGDVCLAGGIGNIVRFKPNKCLQITSVSSTTSKPIQINIIGVAKILIEHEKGREDSNLQLGDQASKLKRIEIKDWNNVTRQTYVLHHNYLTSVHSRLALESIFKYGSGDVPEKYFFQYFEPDLSDFALGKDYWGFLNIDFPCKEKKIDDSKLSSPRYSKTNILTKITYPTGGCAVFEFESNTYSYIGQQPIQIVNDHHEFYDLVDTEGWSFNNANNSLSIIGPNQINYNTIKLRFSTDSDQRVLLRPSIVSPPVSQTRIFELYEDTFDIENRVGIACATGGCCLEFILRKGHNYYVRLANLEIDNDFTETLEAHYFEKDDITRNYNYGGGNRIKRISFYATDVVLIDDEFSNLPLDAKRQFDYSYQDFNEIEYSSGSLVFPVPLFNYETVENPCFRCIMDHPSVGYSVSTSYNNLQPFRTKGSDIGYKHITVSETNNGMVRYVYSTPRDVPEDGYLKFGHVFFPSPNFDYKRGNVLEETYFNSQGDTVKHISYQYEYDEYLETTGLKFYVQDGEFVSSYLFQNYGQYESMTEICATPANCPNFCHAGNVEAGVSYNYIKEAYGWITRIHKTVTEYSSDFQNVSLTFSEVTANNPDNLLISYSEKYSPSGDFTRMDYYYHSGNSTYTDNRIGEIERIVESNQFGQVSEKRIQYSNAWSNTTAYLPQMILLRKGSEPLEPLVLFDEYDEFGQPRQYRKSNGVPVSILYDRNHYYPIAIIKNQVYSAINPSLADQYKSNPEDKEVEFRNSLSDETMCTTIIHKPLVGVESITSPNDAKTKYEYDGHGRLKTVIGNQDETLSEYLYHYRTQE